MKSLFRNRWLRLALRLAIAAIVLFIMLRWFEQSQVYHPTREVVGSPKVLGASYQDVSFQTSDGLKLHGWFIPGTTNESRQGAVFIVCHGNGGNISHRLEQCGRLLRTGAGVFIFDYRGYGNSEGSPSEEGTYLDAQAAYNYLRPKIPLKAKVIAYGESLGGAVATELAKREAVDGLVLQSTFTSVPDCGAELFPWLPVRMLGRIRYDTLSKLPDLKVPVLVMHSRSDTLIGFHHAEKNFAAVRSPKRLVELRGDHNDPVWDEPEFGKALEEFLKTVNASE